MSETLDFAQMAETLNRQWRTLINSQESDQAVDVIAARLREIWNARGAADIAAVRGLPAYRSDVGDQPFQFGVAEGRSDACRIMRTLDQ